METPESKMDYSGESVKDVIWLKLEPELQSACSEIVSVWEELWEPEEKEQRIEILANYCTEEIKKLLEPVIDKERASKEQHVERVEKLLDEIATLSDQLAITIPYKDVQSLPLNTMAVKLNQKAQKYRLIRDERVNQLNELCQKEAELSEALGTKPEGFDISEVPSEEQLLMFEKHVKIQEDEKRDRMVVFMDKRNQIMDILNLLGETPKLAFEKDVVSDDVVSSFKVTNENMAKLDEFLHRLEGDLSAARERREAAVKQLKTLWAYLEEPQQELDDFLEQTQGFSVSDMNAILLKLEECKRKKSENICLFVERARMELVKLWDECLVSRETRDAFRPFKMTVYSEELYEIHEIEINKWRDFIEKNKNIFDLLARHSELFEQLKELDGRGKNAKRYKNRGGQLLQEEKQRKVVAKELPRIEQELRNVLAEFEGTNKYPFTANGVPLTKVLDEQWAANFDAKIVAKFQEFGSARKMLRTPLAMKRPAATPLSACDAKLSKLATTTPRPNRLKPPRAILFKSENLEPTYDDFKKTLNSRVEQRSVSRSTETITPPRVLRSRTSSQNTIILTTPSKPTPKWGPPLPSPKTVPRRAKQMKSGKLPVIL